MFLNISLIAGTQNSVPAMVEQIKCHNTNGV